MVTNPHTDDDPAPAGKGQGRDRGRFDYFGDAGEALIALFYVGGSLLFFADSTSREGVWLFLIGSLIWLSRPLVRMARREGRR